MMDTLIRLFKALFTIQAVGNIAKLGILSLLGAWVASSFKELGKIALDRIKIDMVFGSLGVAA